MPAAMTASVIKVTTLGGDVKEVDFVEGKDVAYYLGKAGAQLGEKSTVSVDGKPATVKDPVPENAVLIVAPKISNG
ncbi:hypothetical protein HY624_02060 [Candidatus Uhrbacteria bacterium]|nr:hypothetical protein [Candidatus Uhrbacteria bacterium]